MGRADAVGYLRDALEATLGTPSGMPAYEAFVRAVVLQWPGLFTVLVAGGELAVGLALLAGFPPRVGALGGVFLASNYALAFHNRLLPPSGNFMLAVLLLLLASERPYRRFAFLPGSWRRARRVGEDKGPDPVDPF